jgi:hypothetical protein
VYHAAFFLRLSALILACSGRQLHSPVLRLSSLFRAKYDYDHQYVFLLHMLSLMTQSGIFVSWLAVYSNILGYSNTEIFKVGVF